MMTMTPRQRLVTAVFVAGLVFITTWAHTRGEIRKASGKVAMRPVLVVAKPAEAGRVLGQSHVDVRQIPANFIEPGALSSRNDFKKFGEVRARIPLMKGEQLTRSKLESESFRLGLAWSLPPGFCAVALRLAPEEASGGHLLPGDFVSVLGARSRSSDFSTIIDRARVVAVNDRRWEPGEAAPSPQAGVAANEFFLVTLLLTREQALRVSSVAKQGQVTLALRSQLDDLDASTENDNHSS